MAISALKVQGQCHPRRGARKRRQKKGLSLTGILCTTQNLTGWSDPWERYQENQRFPHCLERLEGVIRGTLFCSAIGCTTLMESSMVEGIKALKILH